ncbi:MAG: PEP-CTERM sorting domain-containing protein [Acidobacteriota bacterium]
MNFSDGSSKVVQTLSGVNTDTFFGYISDTAFNSLTIKSANQGSFNQETFTLDNLAFAPNACVGVGCGVVTPPVTGAPEPATFSMIGAALAGLGLMARRRRS